MEWISNEISSTVIFLRGQYTIIHVKVKWKCGIRIIELCRVEFNFEIISPRAALFNTQRP